MVQDSTYCTLKHKLCLTEFVLWKKENSLSYGHVKYRTNAFHIKWSTLDDLTLNEIIKSSLDIILVWTAQRVILLGIVINGIFCCYSAS